MKILVTGSAGFIGFHVSKTLLERGDEVVGFDNLNHYYDPSLKQGRLDVLKKYKHYTFHKCDLCDFEGLKMIFNTQNSHKISLNF